MKNCEVNCCQKMVKRSLKSAITLLETMKETARQEEVKSAVMGVRDMLATYDCVGAACLRKRAETVAKTVNGIGFFLSMDQELAVEMFISEMKAFISE